MTMDLLGKCIGAFLLLAVFSLIVLGVIEVAKLVLG